MQLQAQLQQANMHMNAQMEQSNQRFDHLLLANQGERKNAHPPVYDGKLNEDLELWIFATEEYYSSKNNLGKTVLNWYRAFSAQCESENVPKSWSLFKTRLRERFRPKDFEYNLRERLFHLKQTGSIHEYVSRFQDLLSQSELSISEMEKRFYFQNGLRNETAKKIKEESPSRLADVIEIASNFEFAHFAGKSPQTSSTGSISKPKAEKKQFSQKSKDTQKDDWKKTATCHKCGKKGHVAPDCRAKKETANFINGSFYAILEVSAKAFSEDTEHVDVSAFIDNGCGINGISPELAEKLHLIVEEDPSQTMQISLGFGETIVKPKRLAVMHLAITGFPILRQKFQVMPIPEGKDVILGMMWLREQNPETDWEALKLKPRDVELLLELNKPLVKVPQPVKHCQLVKQNKEIFNFYCEHGRQGSLGETKIITPTEFEKELRQMIMEWTKEMVKAGIIRPSTSAFSAPTFCVKKPVGWRIVHDYRQLNQKTILPAIPMPRKEDTFDAMSKSQWFSCMDLLWGYYQVKLRESDIPFTAFSTPDGLFEYLVTPMGLSGSPGTFNRLLQKVFSDLRDVMRIYFDNIYVFTTGRDVKEHVAALDRVLKRCEEQQLYIKLSKCQFCVEEIPCLGDFVGRNGVRMDPDKVRIITEWPVPKTKHQMESFLGTTVYVSRFCKDYAQFSGPLHEALKGKRSKDTVRLDSNQLQCFEELKRRLSTPPVLALPDFDKPFGIRMDASNYAVGGVLFQKEGGIEHPIAFTGRKMKAAELNYPVQEQELLAIMHALRVWRIYLVDKPFMVETDHKSLETILTQKTTNRRIARWFNELAEFQPQFVWIAGKTNGIADALSRRPDFEHKAAQVSLKELLKIVQDREIVATITAIPVEMEAKKKYAFDKRILDIMNRLNNSEEVRNYTLHEGLLFFRTKEDSEARLVIPDDEDLKNRVTYENHDVVTAGHPGYFKTYIHVQKKYYWPPLPITKHGNDAIMVIVDRLTKRSKFMLTKSTASAEDTAILFTKHYVKDHGIPKSTVSDRDTKFTSKFWTELMKSLGTKHNLSSAFRPQTDGQTERTNRLIEDYLRGVVNPSQNDWDEYLSLAEFAYNRRVHSAIGMSPFEADLGYNPYMPDDVARDPQFTNLVKSAKDFVLKQEAFLKMTQDAMSEAQERMKHYYDRNRNHQEFQIGDEVLLNGKNLDIRHKGFAQTTKLAPRYIGPYKIIRKVHKDSYELLLPKGLKLHPVFHTSLLKPYQKDDKRTQEVRKVILADGSEGQLVKTVIGHRKRKSHMQYKIWWLGETKEPATWVPIDNLKQVQGHIDLYWDAQKK
ncbi:Retrovirus polyprotein, partial [Globisporangium splendens]